MCRISGWWTLGGTPRTFWAVFLSWHQPHISPPVASVPFLLSTIVVPVPVLPSGGFGLWDIQVLVAVLFTLLPYLLVTSWSSSLSLPRFDPSHRLTLDPMGCISKSISCSLIIRSPPFLIRITSNLSDDQWVQACAENGERCGLLWWPWIWSQCCFSM